MFRSLYLALLIVLLVGGFMVLAVGEAAGGITLWNAFPLIAGLGAIAVTAQWSSNLHGAAWTFLVVAAILTTAVHALWYWDIGETMSGSSTSGLIFLFAPLYTFAISSAAALLACGIGLMVRIVRRYRKRREPA